MICCESCGWVAATNHAGESRRDDVIAVDVSQTPPAAGFNFIPAKKLPRPPVAILPIDPVATNGEGPLAAVLSFKPETLSSRWKLLSQAPST